MKILILGRDITAPELFSAIFDMQSIELIIHFSLLKVLILVKLAHYID